MCIFLDSLKLALEPAGIYCLEFPPEGGWRSQDTWVDLRKALFIADNVMGRRAKPT